MTPTADEIEDSLRLATAVLDPIPGYAEAQRVERADRWDDPREAVQPSHPWPSQDNPMLRYLLAKAEASLSAGMDTRMVLTQLAVHAWFEGGIENYDRGQAAAREPHEI